MKWPWQLYHWHFEVSGKCTLRCPRCPRNESQPVPWLNDELDLAFFKKVLCPDLLRDTVKRITMCGDIGDPIYASQYLEIIAYIKSVNPKIHVYTITNGSYRKAHWWKEFASVSNEFDTVNFSVDGYDDASNNLYRRGSNWDSIMTGMDIMCHQSAAFVYWAAIIFAFNQDHRQRIRDLARDMGCDGVQWTHSTKFGSKYGAAYQGSDDALEPRPEFVSGTHRYQRYFESLTDRIPPNQDYLHMNEKSFEHVDQEYQSFIKPMCMIGNRGIYVSADGVLHPCSWVSYPYQSLGTDRKIIRFENSFHQTHRSALDLKQRRLQEVLDDKAWCSLFHSFNDDTKAWVECEQKCHKDLVNKEYAVGWFTN
jgi:MoaA/NifB/PqqE/SkfB family radical SAM enzyme